MPARGTPGARCVHDRLGEPPVRSPLIDIGSDPAIERLDRAFFAGTGLHYAGVDLSVFHHVPIALGVVRAPAGVPGAVGVGAGAAATAGQAWWKALAEAFAARAAGAKLELLVGERRRVPDWRCGRLVRGSHPLPRSPRARWGICLPRRCRGAVAGHRHPRTRNRHDGADRRALQPGGGGGLHGLCRRRDVTRRA